MAEKITIKVEPLYFDSCENADETKPECAEKQDDTDANIQEQKLDTQTEPETTAFNFVMVKSEVESADVKEEPKENDFILPDVDMPEESLAADGVSEEDLNRNAVLDGKHACEVCRRLFSKKSHLRIHAILHSRERLECHICLLRLERLDEYTSHLSSHNMKYSCFVCCKRFKTFNNLENHKRIHSDIKFFKCDHCSKEFTQKANLSRHQKLGGCKNKADLTCPFCDKVFEREFFLKSHLKKHTSERPFQCDLCFMFFKHKSTLARHIQIHNGVRPYACKFCNKTFTHKGLLEPHLRKHTGEKPFPCPGCNKSFSHKHNMQRHFERHAKEKNLECKLCNKVFPRESRLIYHMRSHTNSKPFKCDVCGRKFTHKSNVLRHYSRKHPNDKYEAKYTDATVAKQVWEKVKQKLLQEEGSVSVTTIEETAFGEARHVCDLCEKKFRTIIPFKKHMLGHKRVIECHACLIMLDTLEDYEAHLHEHSKSKAIADSIQLHGCDECHMKFPTELRLKNHKLTHSQQFTCESCNKQFVKKRNLITHVESKRCTKPCFKCDLCDKEFFLEHLLKSHLRKHTTERPFQCTLCQVSFKYKSALMRHYRRHKKEKLYRCDQCDKTFESADSRKRHLPTHSGEKPFSCQFCEKTFAYKHNMKTHLKRHSKKKNLVCLVCEKAFPTESRLIYHMKSHTNSRPFGCDICVKKFSNKQNLMKHYKTKHPEANYVINTSDAEVAKAVWMKIQKKLNDGGDFE